MPTDPLLREVVAVFVIESGELVPRITRDILHLEKARGEGEPLSEAYTNLARGLHTLKGSAGTIGLTELSDLAHRMEDVVAPYRQMLGALPSSAADALLKGLDAFTSRLRAEAAGSPTLPDLGPAMQNLAAVFAGSPLPQPGVPVPTRAARENEAPELRSSEGGEEATWRVSAQQVVGLTQDVERLRELRLRIEERHRELQRVSSMLARLSLFSETAEARALLLGASRSLFSDGEESASIVESLEEGLKQICTLPVQTILDPLHRVTRDLCRKLGKEAQLSIVGAEVSLDRRVLEALRAPLMHLLRNAIDHGIETPAARQERGKHTEGAIVIRVEQQGSLVFIEFSDDGGGIDDSRVREVAVERNLATADEVEAIDPAQLHQFLFRSGFSTTREVTDTSGRGVGLDVVRAQLQSLQGHVEVQSRPGQGTQFTLTIPTELGSSPVILVRCGEHQFGLPMSAVERLIAARSVAVRLGRTRMTIEHGDGVIPLVDLGSLLGLRQPDAPKEGQPVLIVQAKGRRIALAVDEVIDQGDFVIHPSPHEVRNVPAYQGVSTLARGELVMVIRPDWVAGSDGTAVGAISGTRRALVVDDSLTARAMHRSVLEAGGFAVHAVGGAQQALGQLKHAVYDVVVCDVRMQGMDGVAFTKAVRSHDETRSLPIILVSALDSDQDRARGREAGADAFLSKKDCVEGRLLAEVSAIVERHRKS